MTDWAFRIRLLAKRCRGDAAQVSIEDAMLTLASELVEAMEKGEEIIIPTKETA